MITARTGLVLAVLAPTAFSLLIPTPPAPILGISPSTSVFSLHKEIVGTDFFRDFKWETFEDPTHGRVNYVDQTTALARNLTMATPNSFIMRADDTNVVSKDSRGRDSNRITSRDSYTDSVIVLDVRHVPWGCSTWPAFWTVTDSNWPYGGEIDVIEGVNTNEANLASLHTSPGCQMAQTREQTGTTTSTDCNAYDNSNQGCGTAFKKHGSYGHDLNVMGGGWFVMKRTQTDGVYIWFWGRNDPTVPLEVRRGDGTVFPDESWGTPEARFPSSNTCNFASHFDAHQIVFDLTFCGDWAGNVFQASGCGPTPSTCNNYVDNNPQDFKDAYWEINALRIYILVESSLIL